MPELNQSEQNEPRSTKVPQKSLPDIPAGTDDVPSNRYGANIQLIRRRLLDEKRTADWLRRRKGK